VLALKNVSFSLADVQSDVTPFAFTHAQSQFLYRPSASMFCDMFALVSVMRQVTGEADM